MLYLLAVHDSDKVHNIYATNSKEEMLELLRETKWWEDITSRVVTPNKDDEEEIKEENSITLEDITNLYHDGDSEVGYVLKSDSGRS